MARDLELDVVEDRVNLVVDQVGLVARDLVVIEEAVVKVVNNMICELCNREIPKGYESEHHLVPKCRGGRHGDTAMLHPICHKQIHALFDEHELEVLYNTISKLKNHRDVKRFVKWVKNKPIEFNSKTKIRRKRR